MTVFTAHRRFSELVGGFLALGLGQNLLGIGLFKPLVDGSPPQPVLALVGGLLFLAGVIFLGRLVLWLLKDYNQDNRLIKLFFYCLVISGAVGFILGGLGQLLYDHTSLGYMEIKQAIWICSSFSQALLRLAGVYVAVCFVQNQPILWRDRQFQLILLVGMILVGIGIGLSLWLPQVAWFIQYLLDTAVVIGPIYYFLIRQRE